MHPHFRTFNERQHLLYNVYNTLTHLSSESLRYKRMLINHSTKYLQHRQPHNSTMSSNYTLDTIQLRSLTQNIRKTYSKITEWNYEEDENLISHSNSHGMMESSVFWLRFYTVQWNISPFLSNFLCDLDLVKFAASSFILIHF